MNIIIAIALVIYIASAIEIVGSHILTRTKQGVHWEDEFMYFPLFFPPLAPIVAFDIFTDAYSAYNRSNYNNKVFMESPSLYVWHGFRSINEWIDHKRNRKKQNRKKFQNEV